MWELGVGWTESTNRELCVSVYFALLAFQKLGNPVSSEFILSHTKQSAMSLTVACNLRSSLLRCGTRPNEWGTQWDSNSLLQILTVACLLGWDNPCKCRNASFLNVGGMYGLGKPNLTSQYRVLYLKGARNSWRAKEESASNSWLGMSLLTGWVQFWKVYLQLCWAGTRRVRGIAGLRASAIYAR